MAIIDSIILGRAKGSIGNVTLSTQKGRVIAKQKATIVSNPNTVAQQSQRGKLAKGVIAWQKLSNVIKSGWTSLMQFSSAYNTYISKNIDIFADKDFTDSTLLGMDLVDSFGSYGSLGNINYYVREILDDSAKFNLDKAVFSNVAKVGDKLKIVIGGQGSEELSYSETYVTQAMLDAQEPFVSFNGLALDTNQSQVSCMWLESADGKNSTTSKFKIL